MSVIWLWIVLAQVFGCGVLVGLTVADWQEQRDYDEARRTADEATP